MLQLWFEELQLGLILAGVTHLHFLSHNNVFMCQLNCVIVARTCNIIFLVLDVLKPLQHKKLIEHELEGFGIRLNKKAPNIYFRKKDKGGINLTSTVRFRVMFIVLSAAL